jgi:hypothetical protein
VNFTLSTTLWRQCYNVEITPPVSFDKNISLYVYKCTYNAPAILTRTTAGKISVCVPNYLGSDLAGKTGVIRILYSDSNIPEG